MKIEVRVSIDDHLEEKLILTLPGDLINLYGISQFVSDFIADRLIKSGYPKSTEQ
jgi:hypothetical protein